MKPKKQPSDGSISKIRLARAYAPGLSDQSARKRLQRWIHGNPRLLKALQSIGYSSTQKKFTKNQKLLIYRYIGSPNGGAIKRKRTSPHF